MRRIFNLKLKLAASLISALVINFLSPTIVKANGLCGIFPCEVASPCLGTNCDGSSLTVVGSILQIVLGLVFVGIITYGIWLIVQAAIKIIRSEGDEAKIQEGFKLVKGAYTGLILIFVGIIGLVIVFVIFNATDIFKVTTDAVPPGINIT